MTEPPPPDKPPQVPIVPGPSYQPPPPPAPAHEPPTQAYPPVDPPPQVYYQQPAPAAPPQSDWRPGRVASNTVVVVLTIVGIAIGVPLLCCGFWLVVGLFTEGVSGGN